MKPIGSKALIAQAVKTRKNGRIDVVELATNLGIDVYAVSSDVQDYNAHIQYNQDKDRFEIFVNSDHPGTRQRFSIAHELSHYALDPDKIVERGSMDRTHVSVEPDEKRADALAAQVLMPDELVDEYFAKNNLTTGSDFTSATVETLAAHFHVSRTMAVLRLREKGCQVPYLSFA